MSALLDEAPVVDTVEVPDSDACQWLVGAGIHGVEAQWVFMLLCCGASRAFCDGHRAQLESALSSPFVQMFVVCTGCQTVGPDYVWLPLGGAD